VVEVLEITDLKIQDVVKNNTVVEALETTDLKI